jgi:lysophospholipase L1-like esterase
LVANLPNFSQIPVGLALAAQDPAAGQALAAVSVSFDLNVINKLAASGIPVADLLCNPTSYQASNFYTDGFHPNDSGYAALAAVLYADLIATSPPAPNNSCTEAGTTAALRAPLTRPIVDFNHLVR